MKQFLWTLAVVATVLSQVHAQPFLQESKQWNIAIYPTFSPGTSSYSLRLEGDTLIDNHLYKKVLRSTDSLNANWTMLNTFLREDSMRRVYIKEATLPEELLYDFSLEAGDTFLVDAQYACTITVTETDSITLNNGEVRKRIKLQSENINGWDYSDIWIDGIGSLHGLLVVHTWLLCSTDYNYGLLCYYKDDELVFPDNPPSCFITPVKELAPEDGIEIYPNPFQHKIFISLKYGHLGTGRATLYSLAGNMIQQTPLRAGQNEIDTPVLPAGTYTVLIETGDGRRYSTPLIKR